MKSTANDMAHPVEWYLRRTEYLARFMLPEREQTLRKTLGMRTRYMTVCTENMFDPHNASALVRHCEAFGIQDMYTIEDVCGFKPSVNIVRGTDKWISLHRMATADEAIGTLRGRGYRIVATSPHAQDCPPETFDVEAGPFALVFGAESVGITSRIAESADEFLRIPMVGFVESLNVSASAAILIYILSRKLRTSCVPWELTEEEKAAILFDWMTSTVKHSQRLLARFRE